MGEIYFDNGTDLGAAGSTAEGVGNPMEVLEPERIAASIASALDRVESRLIAVVREAAHVSRPLPDVIDELVQLQDEIRPRYMRLQEMLERRDLSFEALTVLETQRRRGVWLYRRSRLEQVFFTKLNLERTIRNTLFREILEAYEQLADLDTEESRLQEAPDPTLILELVRKPNGEQSGPEKTQSG